MSKCEGTNVDVQAKLSASIYVCVCDNSYVTHWNAAYVSNKQDCNLLQSANLHSTVDRENFTVKIISWFRPTAKIITQIKHFMQIKNQMELQKFINTNFFSKLFLT